VTNRKSVGILHDRWLVPFMLLLKLSEHAYDCLLFKSLLSLVSFFGFCFSEVGFPLIRFADMLSDLNSLNLIFRFCSGLLYA
jgi:hypothetical protein